MKKLLLFTMGTCVIALLSFKTQSKESIKNIAKDLYSVKSPRDAASGQATGKIHQILGQYYNIKDFKQTKTFSPISGEGGKYKWILDKKAFMNAVEEKLIKYDKADTKMQNKDALELVKVLAKYAK